MRATDGKTIVDVAAWQSFYAVREIISAREFSRAFVLRQWDRYTIGLAFGGGTFTDQGGGLTKYEPPDPSTLDERACIVDWQDGMKDYRLVVPRCVVTENVETNLTRTAAADLPITLRVLAPTAGADPWYCLTNDPAFAS